MDFGLSHLASFNLRSLTIGLCLKQYLKYTVSGTQLDPFLQA
jgi:hypothetical protein